MRSTRLSAAQVTQRDDSANSRLAHPAGKRNSPTTLSSTGSIRESVVRSSVSIQTLSADAARSPGTVPAPYFIVAETLAAFASTFSSALSPQEGTQRLPSAFTSPPQGLAMPAIGSSNLLSLALG